MSHPAIIAGIASGLGAVAGSVVSNGVRASVSGDSRTQDAIALLAGGAADVVVCSIVLAANGIRPTLGQLCAIALGSYAMKKLAGTQGERLPNIAIVEALGGAVGYAILSGAPK